MGCPAERLRDGKTVEQMDPSNTAAEAVRSALGEWLDVVMIGNVPRHFLACRLNASGQ